jgi:hypothetical protein
MRVSLQRLEAALQSAIEGDDAGQMASLLLACAQRRQKILCFSPPALVQAGQLKRADGPCRASAAPKGRAALRPPRCGSDALVRPSNAALRPAAWALR